jgi:hypothetical protein
MISKPARVLIGFESEAMVLQNARKYREISGNLAHRATKANGNRRPLLADSV